MVSRRRLLLLGTPAVVAVAALPFVTAPSKPPPEPPPPTPEPSPTGPFSAHELGISPSNAPLTNRQALTSALSDSRRHVVFPPGDYLVDNSGSRIAIMNYSGRIVMQPGARFVFTDSTRRGLNFQGGTGAQVSGLTTAFRQMPTSRSGAEECITFLETVDTHVDTVRIDGSAAAGLLFWRCIRPKVSNAIITNTMADGLHFANCQDSHASNITTMNTGDDGLAFLNYAAGPAHTGGFATNVNVAGSASRGIAVVGQSGVTVRDFSINGTKGPGLYCAYEQAWATRVPTEARFENGKVVRGGADVARKRENHGISLTGIGTAVVTNVKVDDSGNHGFFCSGGSVTVSDMTITNSRGNGFHAQQTSATIDHLVVENAAGPGLVASHLERLRYGSVTLKNTARSHSTRRAVEIQHNAAVEGDQLWIQDNQRHPTGYIIAAHGSQRGSLGTIYDQIEHGIIVIDNPSGLAYVPVR